MAQVVKFEQIVPEGKAMGRLKDGRAVFCIGPLPNETARVGLRKQKRTYAEAVLREIIEPAAKRNGEAENHHLSCSPWQGVDYEYQCELKADMIRQAFEQHHVAVPEAEFVPSPERFGYRNRLDFTVARIDGRLQLAFHQRGSWDALIPLPQGCRLGSDEMNAAAVDLVAQLDKLGGIDDAVITVRHARTTGQLLTILTTDAKADWSKIDARRLGNFLVTRPLPGSGAPGDTVYTAGHTFITERLAGLDLSYSYNAFFQTNTAAFELALQQMTRAANTKPNQNIVELYSGVGAIGLPLAAAGHQVRGVEIIPEAVEFAERNARAAGLDNYHAEAVAAEHMDAATLSGADCVILDPPRAGLHARVSGWLREAAPQTIIYLSCNPVTQARDLALLQDDYRITSLTGFDFYPGALHVEALAVCAKK